MIWKRMLDIAEAAQYCDLPKSTFSRICPVKPVKLHERATPDYDKLDLDRWIEAVKRNRHEKSLDEMIGSL